MKHKFLFWLIFVLVTALCWVDYQYFTEGHANSISPIARQAGHIAILLAILPIGYIGYKNHPMSWIKKLWLVSYSLVIAIIGIIGLLQWQLQLFGTAFLDQVSSLRLFFCSPVPYFLLYILGNILNRNTGTKTL